MNHTSSSLKQRIRNTWLRLKERPAHVGAILYQRLALFLIRLSMHGMPIPGTRRLKEHLSEEQKSAFEREMLVREIKSSRLVLQTGPLWVRHLGGFFIKLSQRYRFFGLAVFKSLIGVACIVVPIILFILVRGILPVPERVAYQTPSTRLPTKSNMRTDALYTQPPYFALPVSENPEVGPRQQSFFWRGVSFERILERNAPTGLVRVGIGASPMRQIQFRGFLVGEKSVVRVPLQRRVPIDIAGRNHLQIWFYLLPSVKREAHCRLEIRDRDDRLLLASEERTTRFSQTDDYTSLAFQFRQRLTPMNFPTLGQIQEFTLDTDNPPDEFRISAQAITERELTLNNENELSENDCIFAVGKFTFERELVQPLKRRGIVFINAEGINQATATNPKLMPRMAQFLEDEAISYKRAFSPSNETAFSAYAMFQSLPFRKIIFDHKVTAQTRSIVNVMQENGYHSAALGSLSEDNMSEWNESIDLENPHYDTRNLTEEAGLWLEKYGHKPFFLYLHYNAIKAPFRPPFQQLELGKWILSPFGLEAEETLYQGVARYFDQEFSLLQRKLRELGIYDEIDLVITSGRGMQIRSLPFGEISQEDPLLWGAVRKAGPLATDEVHVPLAFKFAKSVSPTANGVMNVPTTTLDILPTLAGIVEDKNPSKSWEGINIFPYLAKGDWTALAEKQSQRNWFYLDGRNYNGVITFDTDERIIEKYVVQRHPESRTVFLPNFPWRKRLQWDSSELVSITDDTDKEQWIFWGRPLLLQNLRKGFLNNAPLGEAILLRALSAGKIDLSLTFTSASLATTSDGFPQRLQGFSNVETTSTFNGTSLTWHFVGSVKSGESLVIWPGSTRLEALKNDQPLSFIGCPPGVRFENHALVSALKEASCLSQPLQIQPIKNLQTQDPLIFVQRIWIDKEFPLANKNAE